MVWDVPHEPHPSPMESWHRPHPCPRPGCVPMGDSLQVSVSLNSSGIWRCSGWDLGRWVPPWESLPGREDPPKCATATAGIKDHSDTFSVPSLPGHPSALHDVKHHLQESPGDLRVPV